MLNRTQQHGRLTRDPETRNTPNGTTVATLRIAVQRPRRDGADQGADFFDVTVWGAQAEACARYLSKGRDVCVDGRLRFREWQAADGSNRSTVDIVANSVDFLPGGNTTGQHNHDEPDPAEVADDGEPIEQAA